MDARLQSIRDTLAEKWESAVFAWTDLSPLARRAIIAGAVAVVVLVAGGLIVWRLASPKPAPPTDDALAVASFVSGSEFDRLPAELKRPYMQSARKHLQRIEAACREGKIDKRTYRYAYLCSWMDRRLEDMEGYYNKPPAKRQAFLDELLAEKVKAPEKAGTTAGMGAKGTGKLPGPKASDKPKQPKQPDKPSDKSDTSLLYEDEEGRQKFEEKKDKFEDDFLDSWTPERKEQWKQFRRAYTERRKQLEAVAGATTAPAGPPAKAPAKTGVAGAAK